MRSTTFDMIGIILTAIATILICGGMATWAYLRESRGGTKRAPAGAAPPAETSADETGTPPPSGSEHQPGDQRLVAPHR